MRAPKPRRPPWNDYQPLPIGACLAILTGFALSLGLVRWHRWAVLLPPLLTTAAIGCVRLAMGEDDG